MTWKTPESLMYTKTDEWIMINGQSAIIGITDYAQDQLSDIVYVELPAIDDTFNKSDIFATVESVKAAADINMPVDATVTETNDAIEDEPELINTDPYEAAWFIKIDIQNLDQTKDLMNASEYIKYCESRSA